MTNNRRESSLLFGKHYYYTIITPKKMARTNSRSTKMNRQFIMRCHDEDLANLKLAAAERGVDVSSLIRQTLIKERLINPV